MRGEDDKIRAFYNTCRHRGALVCTERAGSRRSFKCIYHGWTYRNDGVLAGEVAVGICPDKRLDTAHTCAN